MISVPQISSISVSALCSELQPTQHQCHPNQHHHLHHHHGSGEVDLKKSDSRTVLQKKWLYSETKNYSLTANHMPVHRNKGLECSFVVFKGAVVNRVLWRKLQVQSIETFYWLSCGSLPLAELLPGQGVFLLPRQLSSIPYGGRWEVCCFPLGSVVCVA